eukprot:jgi/Bigna1/88647/estExt_fgenesh1_pg.C_350128
MGITVVVSILEPWEYIVPTRLYNEQFKWLELGALDFCAPSDNDLNIGVQFLKKQTIELHQKAYVHCNAGRGRSAVLVALYLRDTISLFDNGNQRHMAAGKGKDNSENFGNNNDDDDNKNTIENERKKGTVTQIVAYIREKRPQVSKSLTNWPFSYQARTLYRLFSQP